MTLQTITNINVDFHDNKYILINAKQCDDCSRWITITCYDNGKIFNLSASKHTAYIRYKKADGYGVLNSCRINTKSEVLVELTEQMLAIEGVCYADLIIVDKGNAIVNVDTGEIITVDGSPIISTMAFCVNVYESSFDNSLVESSYEFNALNNALQMANAEYTEVMKTSKSWAVGDTGVREGEDTNNSKYYANQSSRSASASNTSALNAAASEELAESHMNNALAYKNDAETYMNNAESHMDNAKSYMDATNEYMGTTESYMNNAYEHMNNAKSYMETTNSYMDATELYKNDAETYKNNTYEYMNNASTSESNAKTSEANALNSANSSQSYAVGGTGTRENEDVDNAKYYFNKVIDIVNGLNNAFLPMGTITFADLSTVEKVAGYVYNISDDFVTDDTFAEGQGKFYTAGTNVYYTANNEWDCLSGSSLVVATVSEVKDYLSI